MIKIKTSTAQDIGSRKSWWFIATWFGCGLSPVMCGTVGSLAALPFAALLHYFIGNEGLMIASVLMFFVGWWASRRYLKHAERNDDPSEIVVDEVAAQWLLLAFLPLTWQAYAVGFLLFRAFDIIKPWPVSLADSKIKGAFGVMFDDTLAALYPLVIFILIGIYAPELAASADLFIGGADVQP